MSTPLRRLTAVESNNFSRKKRKINPKEILPPGDCDDRLTHENKTSIHYAVRPVSIRMYTYTYIKVIVPFSRIVGRCTSSEHDRGKRKKSESQ